MRISQIIKYFAILSVFIAGLGLLGLAAFSAKQRTKKIGIRKTPGASISSIVRLLTKDFLKMDSFSKSNCLACCVFCYEQMAAKFCLSHKYRLVDFCIGRRVGDCLADC